MLENQKLQSGITYMMTFNKDINDPLEQVISQIILCLLTFWI